MELAGIPRQVDDNQLETKVLWFFEKVGCKIDSGFIDDCHRLGKNNEGVILKFARRKDCKQVVQVKNIKYFCVYIKDLLHVVFISSIFVFISRIRYMLCLYQLFLCLCQGFVICCVYIKDLLYVVFISSIFTVQSFFLGISSAASLVLHFHCKTLFFP